MEPFQIVPIQLKVLMAEGTAMTIVDKRERRREHDVHARNEHVVAPHDMKPSERRWRMMENTIAR